MKLFLCLFSLLSITTAVSRITPPPGALVVGRHGRYSKIQDAINDLSRSSTKEQVIFIEPGTYNEQVSIPSIRGPLTIYGSTADVLSHSANRVIITAGASQLTKPSDDLTATLSVHTSNFKLYNVKVVNSHGPGIQAVALSAYAPNQGYYACSFIGYQDTVLAEIGAQLYAKCYIEGVTDFIFGEEGQAWVEQCDIGVLPASKGYITASGRDSATSKSFFVINSSNVAAAGKNKVPKGAYYLGRPWRDYARVVFQNTRLSDVVNPAGWSGWDAGDERTGRVVFGEYRNSGVGSQGSRAASGQKLGKFVSMGEVLGSGFAGAFYFDKDYV